MFANIPATIASIVAVVLALTCTYLYIGKQSVEKDLLQSQKELVEYKANLEKAEKELIKAQNDLANKVSTEFENNQKTETIRVETIIKEQEKIVERPVYTNICLDEDGRKNINDLIKKPIKEITPDEVPTK